jgi:hypothetical protein
MRMLSTEEARRRGERREDRGSERDREEERRAIQGVADRSFVRESRKINRQINASRGTFAITWNWRY